MLIYGTFTVNLPRGAELVIQMFGEALAAIRGTFEVNRLILRAFICIHAPTNVHTSYNMVLSRLCSNSKRLPRGRRYQCFGAQLIAVCLYCAGVSSHKFFHNCLGTLMCNLYHHARELLLVTLWAR